MVKYFSRDTSVLKQSLSLTQKEKVVSDFVSKAEKEAHFVHSQIAQSSSLCTQSNHKLTLYTVKSQYLIPLTKNQ